LPIQSDEFAKQESDMSKSATMESNTSIKQAIRPHSTKSGFAAKTKFIIGAGALILVLGGLIIASRPDSATVKPVVAESRETASAQSAGRLTSIQAKYNFGPVSMAQGKVTHRYLIRNSGTEPITVRKLYTSCMCTTAALIKNGKTSEAFGMPGHTPIPAINVPIAPQDNTYVEVIFDPAAHGPAGVGPIERVVTIENSAGQPLELAFAAFVSP